MTETDFRFSFKAIWFPLSWQREGIKTLVTSISKDNIAVRMEVQDFSSEQLNGKSTLPPLGQMRIAHKQHQTPEPHW